MIVVCTGSRKWRDEAIIKNTLMRLLTQSDEQITIVVGFDPVKKTPKGVDKIVYKWGNALGFKVITEPADWENGRVIDIGYRHVNLAGFDRNELMLDKYKPNLVLAFRAQGVSNGTDHCVKEAHRRNISVEVVYEKGES